MYDKEVDRRCRKVTLFYGEGMPKLLDSGSDLQLQTLGSGYPWADSRSCTGCCPFSKPCESHYSGFAEGRTVPGERFLY